MTDQLNIYEFGKAMDGLRVELSRLANRADELHRIEWEELRSTRTALKLVFDKLPELNDKMKF